MTFKINKEYSKSTKASRNNTEKLRNQKKLALGENSTLFFAKQFITFRHTISQLKMKKP